MRTCECDCCTEPEESGPDLLTSPSVNRAMDPAGSKIDDDEIHGANKDSNEEPAEASPNPPDSRFDICYVFPARAFWESMRRMTQLPGGRHAEAHDHRERLVNAQLALQYAQAKQQAEEAKVEKLESDRKDLARRTDEAVLVATELTKQKATFDTQVEALQATLEGTKAHAGALEAELSRLRTKHAARIADLEETLQQTSQQLDQRRVACTKAEAGMVELEKMLATERARRKAAECEKEAAKERACVEVTSFRRHLDAVTVSLQSEVARRKVSEDRAAWLEKELEAAQESNDVLYENNHNFVEREKFSKKRITEVEAELREANAVGQKANGGALRHTDGTSGATLGTSSLVRPRAEGGGTDSPLQKRSCRPLPEHLGLPSQLPTHGPVVALSGFRDTTDPALVEYSIAGKRQTRREIKALGGRIIHLSGVDFDPAVTHVVNAPGTRTICCLAALLTGKWVVDIRWVRDSHAVSRWIDGALYGFRGDTDVVKGKKVFLSARFKRLTAKIPGRDVHCTLLVETYGRGHLVEALEDSEWVFVTPLDDRSTFAPRTTYTWEEFIEKIHPGQITPLPIPSAANIATSHSSSSSSGPPP